jgi:hypothetical protein
MFAHIIHPAWGKEADARKDVLAATTMADPGGVWIDVTDEA